MTSAVQQRAASKQTDRRPRRGWRRDDDDDHDDVVDYRVHTDRIDLVEYICFRIESTLESNALVLSLCSSRRSKASPLSVQLDYVLLYILDDSF